MADWNGKERRSRVTGHPAGDLSAREARRLRRSYRLNTLIDEMFEKRYVIGTIIFMQFLLLGVAFYGIVNTNNQAAVGITETKRITEFISQFVQTSSEVGARRNNNIANGLSCTTQILADLPERRTQPQVDACRAFFADAVVPPPTKEQIEQYLSTLRGKP